jgi:hypothetical protein
MKQNRFPKGWNETRVRKLLAHYEVQTEEEAVAEDEAAFMLKDQAVLVVPRVLVPEITRLIARRAPGRHDRAPAGRLITRRSFQRQNSHKENVRVSAHLPLRDAYPFGAKHGLAREVADIENMKIEWDSPTYTSSVRRGYIIDLFQRCQIFDEFKRRYWLSGDTRQGMTRTKRYLQIKRDYETFLKSH